MEFEKAVIIGVSPQNYQNTISSKHMVAEVVLIDKSQSALRPLLYQLKKNSLSETSVDKAIQDGGLVSVDRDAFMMVGEVLSIDKKKKMIHLSNQNTVSYKHLIVANDEEFSHAIHALIDALKVQKKIPSLSSLDRYHATREHPKYSLFEDGTLKAISKLIYPKNQPLPRDSKIEKPLYELQLNQNDN